MTSTLDSYTGALDALTFSNEAKARMTARLAAAAAEGAASEKDTSQAQVLELPVARRTAAAAPTAPAAARRPRRWRRVAAAVAVTAALGLGAGGATVAVAAGILPNPVDVLSDIFGESPAETELIGQIGHPVDATATSNGVTVTAAAVIGDRYNYTVVFDLTREGGWPLDEVRVNDTGVLGLMASSSFSIDGLRSAGGGAYFYDADPTDDTIQYVIQLQSSTMDDQSLIGHTARFQLDGINIFNEDATLTELVSGSWNLKFKMNYGDTTVELTSGQTVGFGDAEATITQLQVSSLGVTVSYTMDGVPTYTGGGSGKMSDHDQAEQDRFMNLPLVVTFADGTTEDLTECAATMDTSSSDHTDVQKGGQFSRIVDVADIVSVTVGDVTVPVS